jgi:hypothetical protein
MRGPPHLFSRIELQGRQPAACLAVVKKTDFWVEHVRLRAGGFRRRYAQPNVGHRDVDLGVVRGDAPLHPTDLAAGANPLLPKDLAAVVEIKRGDDPGFLSRDQDVFAVGKTGEDGG